MLAVGIGQVTSDGGRNKKQWMIYLSRYLSAQLYRPKFIAFRSTPLPFRSGSLITYYRPKSARSFSFLFFSRTSEVIYFRHDVASRFKDDADQHKNSAWRLDDFRVSNRRNKRAALVFSVYRLATEHWGIEVWFPTRKDSSSFLHRTQTSC